MQTHLARSVQYQQKVSSIAMRILPFVLLFVVIFGCKEKKQTESASDATAPEVVDSLGLTPAMRETILELSELDCQLLKLYATPYDQKGEAALINEMKRIQEERSNLLAGLLKNESDSMMFSKVQAELKRLSEEDGYCSGADLEAISGKGNRPDGVPSEEKNVKADAERLARLNCRLMEAHKALDAQPGNPQFAAKVSSLKHEKQVFFRTLTLNYGARVIHDPFFRKLVFEAQEQECNYNTEIKASGRVPKGAL